MVFGVNEKHEIITTGQVARKELARVEIGDLEFADKDPLLYCVEKQGNTTKIYPKRDMERLKSKQLENRLKTLEARLDELT